MIRLITSRWGVGIALLLGFLGWIAVGTAVFIDSRNIPQNPITRTAALVMRPSLTLPPSPTATSLPTDTAALTPTETPTDAATPAPSTIPPTPIEQSTDSATAQSTANAASTCPIPAGWVAHNIASGETLFGFVLGSQGTVDVAAIMTGNCLKSKLLTIGQTIYLPPGAAENAPKVDVAVAAGPLPTGPTRTAHCPCTITVHEGWRLEQIGAAVDANPVSFSGSDFLATVGPSAPMPSLAVLSSRPAGKSLEGYMFPGPYTLQNDTSAIQFRDMMLNAFATNVNGQIQADAAARGYTFWQVLVLASVLQRESYAEHEQKLIASVFYNRLAAQKAIAADVTLQYALGRSGNWWPRIVGKMVNIDSPYNTDIYGGIPPSPISSPGMSAILSTVYPSQTNYQYFAAKCGGGGNFYTVTFAEFEQGLKC